MKNIRRLLLSCLSGALVVSGLLVWRVFDRPGMDSPPAQAGSTPTGASGSPVGPTRTAPAPLGSEPEPGPGQTGLSSEEALEALRRDPRWRWRRPIAFWGIVLDEQGQPVPGARVEMTWTDLSQAGHSSATVNTDGLGRAGLEGREGGVLTVRAGHEGFHTTKEAHRILNYAEPWDPQFHRPDPDRPVVLRLRRKGSAEPLVHRENLRFPITTETGEVVLDLVGQRQVASGGDLRIAVQHGPERSVDGRRRFDWDVVIAAVDGGLVAHDEEFPFLAPDSGYVPRIRSRQVAEDPAWQEAFEGRFFLRSRSGTIHARIRLRVSPLPRGAPPTVTVLDYHLNPSGSRNLEYTSELDVSAEHYDGTRREGR